MRHMLIIWERELRRRARQSATYWIRVGLVGGALIFAVLPYGAGASRSGLDALIFSHGIATLLFGLGGALSVADVVGSERREGTLGILLLTPLRPEGVLTGKVTSAITALGLCLLALIPVLVVPTLLGGVMWSEVLRVWVSIFCATALGVAVGVCCSTMAREAKTALISSALLWFLLNVGSLFAFFGIQALSSGLFTKPQTVHPLIFGIGGPFALIPLSLDETTRSIGIDKFWGAVLFIGLEIFGLSIVALMAFRRVWRSERLQSASPADLDRAPSATIIVWRRLVQLAGILHQRRRPRLSTTRSPNPYFRLSFAYGTIPPIIWGALLLGSGATILLIFADDLQHNLFGKRVVNSDLSFLFALLGVLGLQFFAKLLVCIEGGRQLGGDHRSRMLELLLTTPISEREVATGPFRAADRLAAPLRWGISLLFAIFLAYLTFRGKTLGFYPEDLPPFIAYFVGAILIFPLEYRACHRLGSWWALKHGSGFRSAMGTLLLLEVVPWIAMAFLMMTLASTNANVTGVTTGILVWQIGRVTLFLAAAQRGLRRLHRGLRGWIGSAKV